MPTLVRVQCHVPDNADADRRIQGIGGINADGTSWYLPIDDAIRAIIDRKWDFYVEVGGRRVAVIVEKHPKSGRLYLTTEGDGFPPNNLLSLPRCPGK